MPAPQQLPTLSIVVPVLNEAGQLPLLIEHLRCWQQRGCEVILVDGGSLDGSIAMAEAGGFAVITSDKGRARQMNAGARAATGAILLFLHADSRLPEDADTLIAQALAVQGNSWGRFDVRLEGRHWMLPVIGWLMNWRSRLSGIATGDQGIFVLAATFHHIGGFPDQPLMEDIELSARLCRLRRPACLRQKMNTSGRRWLQRGVWRTIWLMWRLRWAYWRGVPPAVLAERYR